MQIKIYFGDKPVYLCDEMDASLNELLHHPDVVFVDERSAHAVNALLHEIKKPDFHAGIMWSDRLDLLQRAFFKHFTYLEAAGGVVQNSEKKLLFIFRRGKWDLPKGKIEKKESPEIAAAREIEEETGVRGLKLKKKIGDTYHVYEEYGKQILKKTHWFYFSCAAEQSTTAQVEEDITAVEWIATRDIRKPVADTYETIRDVLRDFFDTP